MSFKMIATWDMSYKGVKMGAEILKNNGTSSEALLTAIKDVENNEKFGSVGFGGLPNVEGVVELDAAYMDGDSLKIGAIAGAKNIKNPVLVAHKLSFLNYNNMLVGSGAEKYAQKNGFEFTNMLSKNAYQQYLDKKHTVDIENLSSYDGHDTVCMLALDCNKNISSAVSTSGLFLKHSGRVGDSPISGSGFYADSEFGAAAATGLGEDLMRGCVSYDTVKNIANGIDAQSAVEKTLNDFEKNLMRKNQKVRAMSIIALDADGNYGVASNVWFSFVCIDLNGKTVLKVADKKQDKYIIRDMNPEELKNVIDLEQNL